MYIAVRIACIYTRNNTYIYIYNIYTHTHYIYVRHRILLHPSRVPVFTPVSYFFFIPSNVVSCRHVDNSRERRDVKLEKRNQIVVSRSFAIISFIIRGTMVAITLTYDVASSSR